MSEIEGLLPLNAPSAASSTGRAQKHKRSLRLSSICRFYRKFVNVKNPILAPFAISSVIVEQEKLYSVLQQ